MGPLSLIFLALPNDIALSRVIALEANVDIVGV